MIHSMWHVTAGSGLINFNTNYFMTLNSSGFFNQLIIPSMFLSRSRILYKATSQFRLFTCTDSILVFSFVQFCCSSLNLVS